ncbi:hypothetical protein M011DRAFT_391763, partial [Sporormia fimetaria CBS 119925]
ASEGTAPKRQLAPDQMSLPSPTRPDTIQARRSSDTSMPDISPRTENPPAPAITSVPDLREDSDDDFDLDDEDFAESEAKYKREKARLESRLVDLSDRRLRATSPLHEIMLLSNLTEAHIPHEAPVPTEENTVAPAPAESALESMPIEVRTPHVEEAEEAEEQDVVMKLETSIAPATLALRYRYESPNDRESPPPDFSVLPYLVSGPPTPVSHPDHEPLIYPESMLSAIRAKLEHDAVPEKDPDEVLREYADAYRKWREHARRLDGDKDDHDQGQRSSAEPSVKGSDVDPSSAHVGALLDAQPSTTGRRGYANRFPTEADIEQVIRESLKTAEEERMANKDKQPDRSQWDPEREAAVPAVLSAYEIQRRRFIDTNFQREPGEGVFVYHYEPPEDDFTEEEHKVMVSFFRENQHPKKWGLLAEMIHKEVGTGRTYKDTINHYYATKWGGEFKGTKTRRRNAGGRKARGAARSKGAANLGRSDVHGDESSASLPLTETGRPRRHAAPTFGADVDIEPTGATPTPGRQRRQADAEGTQEKVGRRKGREKATRKPKVQPLAAAPAASPVKTDRKERPVGIKPEEDLGKRQEELAPLTQPMMPLEEQIGTPGDTAMHASMPTPIGERPRSHTGSRPPGLSSYWSVTEQNDFQRNVAHFGTDWAAIAKNMGTKSQTMVKNQYLRLVEGGERPDLQHSAIEADKKRERGEDLGPPPTPTPAVKRRYEPTSGALPRTLAPTPEMADLVKSPPMHSAVPPSYSPPHPNHPRFSTIAQAPIQSTAAHGLISESTLAALPSLPVQSPTAPPPRVQVSQHRGHHAGPQRGSFWDDQPPRMENRGPAQQSALPSRPSHQRFQQPAIRTQDPNQGSAYRPPTQGEVENQTRVERQHEQETKARYTENARSISQEGSFARPFPSSAAGASHPLSSHMPSSSGAISAEARPSQLHSSRYTPAQMAPQMHAHDRTPTELTSQAQGSLGSLPQHVSLPVTRTPPVKDDPRNYSLGPQTPSAQDRPPVPTSQPASYKSHPQALKPPAPVSVHRPAAEPKKSSLSMLLNDDPPEPPKLRKPSEAPSHTSTPLQQTSAAPPPPNHGPSREPYGDMNSNQPSYNRPHFSQSGTPSQTTRQVVDLTSEQSGGRQHVREPWQQRHAYHSSMGPTQQPGSANSPHPANPPNFGDGRMVGNHRAFLSQHNDPRHVPSPPPLNQYNHSPHMHSRTSSISNAPQQPRHMAGSAGQGSQGPAGTSQILQPNPYAQVEPPSHNQQAGGAVGLRASPHHSSSSHARDAQARNEQSQMQNANMAYSVARTPTDSQGPHMRGGAEQFRARDVRDPREFDPQNHDRDSSRELGQRVESIMRERERFERPGAPHPGPDARYQPQVPQERAYPSQRSHTPLSRPEHPSNVPIQHSGHHSMLAENNRGPYGQRPQEEHRTAYREPYPPRDDGYADRMREEQAQAYQHRGMRNDDYQRARDLELREREMRERDPRYSRDEMMRREAMLASRQPPHGAHVHQEQRPVHGAP